jgi:hypothetical protein
VPAIVVKSVSPVSGIIEKMPFQEIEERNLIIDIPERTHLELPDSSSPPR